MNIVTDMSHYTAWTDVPIRFNDVDMLGHVNNTIYPVFFETGRAGVTRGPESPPMIPGRGFVIAQLTVRYLKPITWPGTVNVGTRVLAIGNSSFTMAQAVFMNGTCAAAGECVIVYIDLASGKSTSLEEQRRKYFEKYQ